MSGADAPAETRARGLHESLEIPWRHPRWVLVPFFAFLLLSVLLAVTAPRKYRSSTLILVEPEPVPESFVTPVTTSTIRDKLHTIRQVVLSRTRLEAVVKKLDPYPELTRTYPPQLVAEWMRRAIDIRVQGTDSFSIEFVHKNPRVAMEVTNLLASQFIEDAHRLREEQVQEAYRFIQSNLDEARRTLEEKEAALRRFKEKHMGALPEQLQANLATLQRLQLEQQTLAENIRVLEERSSAREASLAERRLAKGVEPVLELWKARATLAALLERYTEEHPDVRGLRFRIQRLEEQLAQRNEPVSPPAAADPAEATARSSLEQVRRDLAALQEKRRRLDASIAAFQARVERTPQAEQELLALTRDYQQLKENYSVMLKKDMAAEMAQKLERYWKGGYFRILDPAHLPSQPISPSTLLILLAGMSLGLFVGLGLAVVVDVLDRSVKSERELEALLLHPVLVTIPHVNRPERHRRSAVPAAP